VYVSGWLKCYHPEAFCAALINSQPMGFYAPRTLIADAQRHGTEVLPVDVQQSDWDCTLEDTGKAKHALRLGLRMVRGLRREAAQAVVDARNDAPLRDLQDLAFRTRLDRRSLSLLADAGALESMVPDRRQAAWVLRGLWTDLPLFAGVARQEPRAPLPVPSDPETLLADYRTTGVSLHRHPSAFARRALEAEGLQLTRLARLTDMTPGRRVMICGLVSSRQMPSTAKGVVFISLEDETGLANLVVWRDTWQRHRRVLGEARLLRVWGKLQRQDDAVSVLVEDAWSISMMGSLRAPSRDFH
jgi:error-prone DNA polymerase